MYNKHTSNNKWIVVQELLTITHPWLMGFFCFTMHFIVWLLPHCCIIIIYIFSVYKHEYVGQRKIYVILQCMGLAKPSIYIGVSHGEVWRNFDEMQMRFSRNAPPTGWLPSISSMLNCINLHLIKIPSHLSAGNSYRLSSGATRHYLQQKTY